jgi:long-chain acyl-CoA synthetase
MAINNLVDMFLRTVQTHGARMSLMEKVKGQYQGFNYKEFGDRVRNFALGLASLGIKYSDKVALLSENRSNWAISDLAILSLGATNVPIYPTITAKQIEYILLDSETKLVIVSKSDLLEKILSIWGNLPQLKKVIYMEDGAPVSDKIVTFDVVYQLGKKFETENPDYYDKAVNQIKPDDLCGIIYTSGTTGSPKGVMLTHNNLLSNVLATLDILKVDETDILLSFLPLCHSFERMAGHFLAICAGATIAYAECVETVADNMGEIRPTLMATVPRLLEKIYARVIENAESGSPLKKKIFWWAINIGGKYIQAKAVGKVSGWLNYRYNLATKLVFSKLQQRVGGRLRFFASGGAPLSKEIAEFLYKAGILVLEGYGLTESSPVICVNHEQKFKFGSVGPVIPGVEVKIAPDGEILTRGPHVMKGYYKKPEATAESIDADGWLATGDIGYFDNEGFLAITDRKKNIIVTSGGKNVTPASIENSIVLSPYIEQVLVIGDKRRFLSALIVPSFNSLTKYAIEQVITHTNIEELIANEKVIQLIKDEIQKRTVDFAPFEQIKKFILLPKEFTIESGDLTPSLKIKRKVVEQKYAGQIEKLYEEDNN